MKSPTAKLARKLSPWLEWTGSTWARVALISCFVFLLFFDATRAFHIGARDWQGDDGCYIQHLGDYLGIESAHICVRPVNYFARGAPLLWVLPGLVGKLIAHALNQNVTKWILPLVGISSFVSWAIGLFFMTLILQLKQKALGIKPSQAIWIPVFALLVMFNTYSLHYATVRLYMAHSAEIMLALAFIYFVYKDEYLVALLFAVMLCVTRYNDVPVILLLLGRILDQGRGWKKIPPKVLGLVGGGALGILGSGAYIAFYEGYYFQTIGDILGQFQAQNLVEFFYSPRWGMLWSGSWWLAALGIGMFRFMKSSNFGRAATIWLFLEGFLCVIWGGNGSDFGYRYLIGSYAAAIVVWIEFLESKPFANLSFRILTAANGVWVMLMTLLYQAIPATDVHWNPDMASCYIPPRLTMLMFENLFNFEAYYNTLIRRIVPLAIHYSRNPASVPVKSYRALVGSEITIMTVAATVCVAFILTVIASRIFLRATKSPRR